VKQQLRLDKMTATDLSVVLVMEDDILGVETRAGSLSEAVSIDGRCVFCEEPLCCSLWTAIVPLRAGELAEELGHGEVNLEQASRGPGILDARSGCFVF
jgi:hypothetical protein